MEVTIDLAVAAGASSEETRFQVESTVIIFTVKILKLGAFKLRSKLAPPYLTPFSPILETTSFAMLIPGSSYSPHQVVGVQVDISNQNFERDVLSTG